MGCLQALVTREAVSPPLSPWAVVDQELAYGWQYLEIPPKTPGDAASGTGDMDTTTTVTNVTSDKQKQQQDAVEVEQVYEELYDKPKTTTSSETPTSMGETSTVDEDDDATEAEEKDDDDMSDLDDDLEGKISSPEAEAAPATPHALDKDAAKEDVMEDVNKNEASHSAF